MRKQVLFLLGLSVHLCAASTTLLENVNVITGNLELSFVDGVVLGPEAFPIVRSYNSRGALERSYDNHDLELEKLRKGWLVQGGWNLFPQIDLWIEPTPGGAECWIREGEGRVVSYKFSHQRGKYEMLFTPYADFATHFDVSKEYKNTFLWIDIKKGEATLYLPSGAIRIYQGVPLYKRKLERIVYRLASERLPSGYTFEYLYSPEIESKLQEIRLVSPSKLKVYPVLSCAYDLDPNRPPLLQVTTKDEKEITYGFKTWKGRKYLEGVFVGKALEELFAYKKMRQGVGLSMTAYHQNGNAGYKVSYVTPPDATSEKIWARAPYMKLLATDKVDQISSYNEEVEEPLVHFHYHSGWTDAIDKEGNSSRFYHHKGHLSRIEYRDAKEAFLGGQEFLWNEGFLKAVTLSSADRRSYLSKTYRYDGNDHLVEVGIWGNFTDTSSQTYERDDEGRLLGSECYKTVYEYYPNSSLLKKATNGDGLIYEYQYLPETNLITSLFVSDGLGIWKRGQFTYDEEHILIEEKMDNGSSYDLTDETGVTELYTRQYQIDPILGLPTGVITVDTVKGNSTTRAAKLTYSKSGVEVESETGDVMVYPSYDDYRKTVTSFKALLENTREGFFSFDKLLSDEISLKERKEGVTTFYNNLPTYIDGALRIYNPNGTLAKESYLGEKEVRYTHDLFHRITSKLIYEKGSLTGCEMWTYSAFRMISHTDNEGKTTYF